MFIIRLFPSAQQRTLQISLYYWLCTIVVVAMQSLSGHVAFAQQPQSTQPQPALNLPYKQLGFTDKQAAAYVLDKLAFGARTGEVERVAASGVGAWIEAQLQAEAAEPDLERRMKDFQTLAMPIDQIAKTYPNPGMVLAQAKRDGMDVKALANRDSLERPEYRRKIIEYAQSKGYKPQRELLGEMYAQKLIRAVYAENQLAEVLTDFWFNHFNVSITDNKARPLIMAYERDAIRPHVLGKFRDLVGATAKHPAMLQYLDNAQSSAPDSTPTTASLAYDNAREKAGLLMRGMMDKYKKRAMQFKDSVMQEIPADFRPRKGINENYARELMELHTLGVDGGYTQRDVTEAARVLTGWTMFPIGPAGEKFAERLERNERNADRMQKAGFVQQGAFLFRADAHDATEKTVMGTRFPAGGGIEEGEKLLDMLARHPSTATFICSKLARRFVSDTPPPALVQRLAEAFRASDGDIRVVMRTLVESPEFWQIEQSPKPSVAVKTAAVATALTPPATSGGGKKAKAGKTTNQALQTANIQDASNQVTSNQVTTHQFSISRSKIKSPFELAVSALRALNADVTRPRQVLDWVQKIGQPLYAYQAPTGFPDRAESWINTGSLLNRMNFGLALALGNVKGVNINVAALNSNHEPESAEDALRTYAALLMPERNLGETVRLLKPVVAGATNDPAFMQRLNDAAATSTNSAPQQAMKPLPKRASKQADPEETINEALAARALDHPADQRDETPNQQGMKLSSGLDASTLAQVVGIILGSPEFQRR
jgi:uncharacterized protein (DUF1800 family)